MGMYIGTESKLPRLLGAPPPALPSAHTSGPPTVVRRENVLQQLSN